MLRQRDVARAMGFQRADTASHDELDMFIRSAQVVLSPGELHVDRIPIPHTEPSLSRSMFHVRPIHNPDGDWEELIRRLVIISLLQDGVDERYVQVSLHSPSFRANRLGPRPQPNISPYNSGPRLIGELMDEFIRQVVFQSQSDVRSLEIRITCINRDAPRRDRPRQQRPPTKRRRK